MSRDELEALIAAWLEGRIAVDESDRLQAELRRSAGSRAEFRRLAALDSALRELADQTLQSTLQVRDQTSGEVSRGAESSRSGETGSDHREKPRLVRSLFAAVSALALLLAAGLYLQVTRNEPTIVRVTGLSGSLLWTGTGGQIVSDLEVGVRLPGGTIEGLGPDSWCEMTFDDGTTCMISGESLLTFSDFGQKELRLKEGRFLADVAPQSAGKPMLIHTRSTLLKVLGTRFEVESGLSTTSLQVSEGKVQLKRLSDNKTVDVAARHRLISTPEGDLIPQRMPDPVHDWTSLLQHGPEDMYGNWRPATSDAPAKLKAIPFVPKENRDVTLHLLGLPVWREDRSPVVLMPNSRFLVRGRLLEPADLYFGIRMARENGEFAGMFLARKPVEDVGTGDELEVVFSLDEFGLDPCVWHKKDELPERPENFVLQGVWSFTAIGQPSGLEVSGVELVPPVDAPTQ